MQITLKNVLLSIIFLYILYCSIVIGNMWDSAYHLAQGKNKLNYLFSLGKINKELVWDKYIPGISFAITAFFTSFHGVRTQSWSSRFKIANFYYIGLKVTLVFMI